MTRALVTNRVAIMVWLIAPTLASAQRGIARSGALPRMVVAQPTAPPSTGRPMMGVTLMPGTASMPRGGWGMPERTMIGRTFQSTFSQPRPLTLHFSGLRNGCLGGSCACYGAVRCGRAIIRAFPYGVPIYFPFAVPFVVPYVVPVNAPMYEQAYPTEAAPPLPPPAPGHSKMIVIGSGNDLGGGGLAVEDVGQSLVRLTWLPSPQPAREARLFVADSAQRPLRTQRVDSTSPSALFETQDKAEEIAYAGLTVVMAHGTILTTLVPYRVRPTHGSSRQLK